jgi:colanic acid biosynthesis glycosyl transferase WcaI
MKAVFLSQWYPPEQAPIGYMVRELAQALAARGHDVTVITGFPNHPGGEVFGGYKKRWRLEELGDGFKVRRVWLFTKRHPGRLARIFGFLSFTVTSAWALLMHRQTDLIFGVFQPLSVGVTLPVLARLKGARLVLNVQDLHPDVPIELGLIRNPLLIAVLRGVEHFGYRAADGLAVICEAFKGHCVARGARASSVAVIPNWIDTEEIRPGERLNAFRAEMGISDDDVVVLYAGTIGMVSGAEIVLRTAAQLEKVQPWIRFVFVGEGPALPELKAGAAALALGNIYFAPFQPRERVADIQAMADISLVTLKRGKGRTSVPSKVLGYMAAARPVVASVDGDSETARLVSSAGCGVVVGPEDDKALADAILRLAVSVQDRYRMGVNGRGFLEANYRKATVTQRYAEFFERVLSSR